MQVNVAASLINVASFVIGVRWGAVGVASVSAVSFVFIQTPLLVWSATREGAVSAALLVRAIVPFFIAGIASAIALCLLTQLGGSASLATIVVNEIVAYAVFAVALACLPAGLTFIRGTWNLRTSLRRSL
jgi:PST family polysaccharide transporter